MKIYLPVNIKYLVPSFCSLSYCNVNIVFSSSIGSFAVFMMTPLALENTTVAHICNAQIIVAVDKYILSVDKYIFSVHKYIFSVHKYICHDILLICVSMSNRTSLCSSCQFSVAPPMVLDIELFTILISLSNCPPHQGTG